MTRSYPLKTHSSWHPTMCIVLLRWRPFRSMRHSTASHPWEKKASSYVLSQVHLACGRALSCHQIALVFTHTLHPPHTHTHDAPAMFTTHSVSHPVFSACACHSHPSNKPIFSGVATQRCARLALRGAPSKWTECRVVPQREHTPTSKRERESEWTCVKADEFRFTVHSQMPAIQVDAATTVVSSTANVRRSSRNSRIRADFVVVRDSEGVTSLCHYPTDCSLLCISAVIQVLLLNGRYFDRCVYFVVNASHLMLFCFLKDNNERNK